MPSYSSQYTAKVTQEDGSTLLLRFSPNAYSQYSTNGEVWYDMATITTSGSLEPVLVDGVTIYWENGRLTAKQELPTGGTAGQYLIKTSDGVAWGNASVVGYGDGLDFSSNTVSVKFDNESIILDSLGRLTAVPQLPLGGATGYVLTKTSGGYDWEAPVQYTFSSGLSLSSDTVTVNTDDDTIVVNGAGKLTAPRSIPSGGTKGQFLVKTATGYGWGDAATYVFTGGLSATGNTVVANIDDNTIKLNGAGQLYAVQALPNGGAVGQALLRGSNSTTVWGDPTTVLTFGGGIERIGNTVTAKPDNSTIVVNSAGRLAVTNAVPTATSEGQILTAGSSLTPEWRNPNTFTGGLTTSGNAVYVYLDGETVTLDSAGRVTARSQLPSGGTPDQVLTLTGNGPAWEDPVSPLLFEGGLVNAGNIVSADIDGVTIVLNNSGQLVANEVPSDGFNGQVLTKTSGGYAWSDAPVGPTYTFTGGLRNSGNVITAAVDGSTIVVSGGSLTATPQVPQEGVSGYVLTKTAGGYGWLPGNARKLRFSSVSLQLSPNEVPLYLIASSGHMYPVESISMTYNTSTDAILLDTTPYRAYENIADGVVYEWLLLYTSISPSSSSSSSS